MNIEEAYINSITADLIESPELLAQASADPVNEFMETGGMTLPEDTRDLTLKEFGTMAADVPAGLVKGSIQGTAGVFGDIVSLGQGVAAAINPMPGENRVDAFLRGMEGTTVLPTTEEVSAFLDSIFGPVVPEGEDEMRKDASKVSETVGELFGAGKAIKETAKGVARAIKGAKETPPRGSIQLSSPEFPRVDSIERLPVGPGSIKPRVIAEGSPLFRETNSNSLSDFLRNDQRFDVPQVFVTDNPDLALGQGDNVGVLIQFRANSLSGKVNPKPGARPETGMEYVTDIVAPKAIEKITMKSSKQLKGLDARAKRVLSQEFEKQELESGELVFTRKGTK
jgi:hypothetical protein